jgi:hypothetical protein
VEKILLEIGSEESAAAVRRYVAQMGDVKEVSWPANLPGAPMSVEEWTARIQAATKEYDNGHAIDLAELKNQISKHKVLLSNGL